MHCETKWKTTLIRHKNEKMTWIQLIKWCLYVILTQQTNVKYIFYARYGVPKYIGFYIKPLEKIKREETLRPYIVVVNSYILNHPPYVYNNSTINVDNLKIYKSWMVNEDQERQVLTSLEDLSPNLHVKLPWNTTL